MTARPCPSCGLMSELGQSACARIMQNCAQDPAPTADQIIDRMGSLSSGAIERIIQAGQKTQDERFADGVFE